MEPAASLPATSQNQRPEAPVEVQRQHDQRPGEPAADRRLRDQQQPAGPQHEEHGGYVYKQLGASPAHGTVSDLLEWAIPTEADHHHQVPEGQVHDHAHHAAGDQGGVRAEHVQHSPEPRRSTRAGRGETSRYQDFVQNIAFATYAQMVSGHWGRRASLVVTQSRLP